MENEKLKRLMGDIIYMLPPVLMAIALFAVFVAIAPEGTRLAKAGELTLTFFVSLFGCFLSDKVRS